MLPMPFLAFAGGGGVAGPALSLPFSTWTPAQIAAAGVSANRSGLGWQYDATGVITTGPNNLLLNTATLSTQTVSVTAGDYVLSIMGTGSVALSSGASGTLAGTGVSNRVHLAFTATGSTTFTVTGSVTSARLSRVTYETTMRAVDDVDTTGSAYYGPRLDYDPVTLAAKGFLVEEARTNLLLNSSDQGVSLATQSVTVASTAYTLSFYGTGTVTLSGTSTAGPLVGSGVYPARSTLTFTPTAGSLTLTVTGSVQFAQLEAGSFATSFIPTTTASVTRTADPGATKATGAWYNTTEGTILIDFETMKGNIVSGDIAWCLDATADIDLLLNDGASRTSFRGPTTALLLEIPTTTAPRKIAAAWKSGDYAASLNGAVPLTSAIGTNTAANATALYIGHRSGGSQINGWIKRLDYYNTRRSNADLQLLAA